MASRKQKRPSTDFDEGLDVGKKQKQTPKRPKNTKSSFAQQPDSGVDASGHPYWQLSNSNRRVTIQDYSEKTYVHIREVYDKDGNEAYGKRGIALPIEQFRSLLDVLPAVLGALSEKGFDLQYPKSSENMDGNPVNSPRETTGDPTGDDSDDETWPEVILWAGLRVKEAVDARSRAQNAASFQ